MKILITALIFCIFSTNVFAKEKILDYFVIIDVQDDNSAIITERMIVNVETKKIKKGINKALPLDNDLMYKLISVKRNKEAEPSSIRLLDNIYMIITGDDRYLPTFRRHFFEIKYKVKNIIKHNSNFNELYWNVVGKKWDLDIDRIRIKIILPDNIQKLGQYAYVNINKPQKERLLFNDNMFRSTRKITSGEDITVVLLLKDLSKLFVSYNGKLFILTYFAIIISLFYYLMSLFLVKRKNRLLTPFDRYDILKYITPAQASNIYFMGENKEKSALISLISMAINNFVHVKQDTKDKFIISKNEYKAPTNEEEVIFQNTYKKEIKLSEENSRKISLFNERMKYYFAYNESVYFKKNLFLVIIGNIAFILSLIGLFIVKADDANIFNSGLLPLSFLTIFLNLSIYIKMKSVFKKFICIFIIYCNILYINSFDINSLILLYYITLSFIMLFFFKKFIRNYTEEGEEVVAHIEGIKIFIETQDIKPIHTFSEMEKLLPYAMIFNLEYQWLEKVKLSSIAISKAKKEESFFYNTNEKMLTSLKNAFKKVSEYNLYINPEYSSIRKNFFN